MSTLPSPSSPSTRFKSPTSWLGSVLVKKINLLLEITKENQLFSNILFHLAGWLVGWMDIELHRLFLPDLEINLFLDQRRQMSARDGCICCLTHKNFKPDQSHKPSILSSLFGRLGLLLTNKCVQLAVMLATTVFLAIGMWGTLSLTQVCSTSHHQVSPGEN